MSSTTLDLEISLDRNVWRERAGRGEGMVGGEWTARACACGLPCFTCHRPLVRQLDNNHACGGHPVTKQPQEPATGTAQPPGPPTCGADRFMPSLLPRWL